MLPTLDELGEQKSVRVNGSPPLKITSSIDWSDAICAMTSFHSSCSLGYSSAGWLAENSIGNEPHTPTQAGSTLGMILLDQTRGLLGKLIAHRINHEAVDRGTFLGNGNTWRSSGSSGSPGFIRATNSLGTSSGKSGLRSSCSTSVGGSCNSRHNSTGPEPRSPTIPASRASAIFGRKG